MTKVKVTAVHRYPGQKEYLIPAVHPMGDDETNNTPYNGPHPCHTLTVGVPVEIEVSERLLKDLRLDGGLVVEVVESAAPASTEPPLRLVSDDKPPPPPLKKAAK